MHYPTKYCGHNEQNHGLRCALSFKEIINYLLTKREVCTGKYLPEVFVGKDRSSKRG